MKFPGAASVPYDGGWRGNCEVDVVETDAESRLLVSVGREVVPVAVGNVSIRFLVFESRTERVRE
jgi:hypothetical protein